MAANPNKACCSIPPVESDYSDFKGSFETINGLNTYVSGDANAKKAIIATMDIFGLAPQTKQGVDIIAKSTGARVYLPDYFHGKPISHDQYPPDTKEKEELIQEFFSTRAEPGKNKQILTDFGKELKNRGHTSVGAYGFCWGGKVTILSGGEGTPFAAVAQIHPAFISEDDAKALVVPVASFPSKDEPKEDAAKFEKAVESKPFASKSVFKTYDDQHHGWAAARADLDNESNKKAYEDVYSRLAAFFNDNL
ncbi:hypothetical protein OC846_004583 [Tilletia horrida]|uniref:Dienelactone hydrolase domain-containing protein n=1 Tax=Tilletia horrida TaxID=155126 RepID=A0AAN6GM10_9BASI|nr:hypothetical protein OC846_004583 [Tilletia horrida]KAK0552382.1 hypothetical protein OC845_001757 [Tilletia horrida]KAK0568952.1 hypothetical protein OC861_001389 [Tilletia horrida]